MTTAPLQVVEEILAGFSIRADQVTWLADGATCRAYRIDAAGDSYCLRIQRTDVDKHFRPWVEAEIREHLLALDLAVPRTFHLSPDGVDPWSLDAFVTGGFGERGKLSSSVCHEIGGFLARLHTITGDGYGLLSDRVAPIRGDCGTVVSGLSSRWMKPWPFIGEPLANQAAVIAAPHLHAPLEKLSREIEAANELLPTVLIHGDLHEQQIMIHDDRLAAILDFGDACFLGAVWDLASFRFFHGKRCTAWMIEGYSASVADRKMLIDAAAKLAIVVALHRANRSVIVRKGYRVEQAIDFIEEVLRELK